MTDRNSIRHAVTAGCSIINTEFTDNILASRGGGIPFGCFIGNACGLCKDTSCIALVDTRYLERGSGTMFVAEASELAARHLIV